MIVQQTQFVFCHPIEHQTFHQAFQDVKWTTCTLPGGKSIDALIDYENPIWVLLTDMLMHLKQPGVRNPYSHITFFTPNRMVTFSLHEFGLNRHLSMKLRLADAGIEIHDVDCAAFHTVASEPIDIAPECYHAAEAASSNVTSYNDETAESGGPFRIVVSSSDYE